MPNLGLPPSDVAGTLFSSFSANVIKDTYPSTLCDPLFTQTSFTCKPAHGNGWNYLAFDDYSTRYDAAYLRAFNSGLMVRDNTSLPTDPLNVVLAGVAVPESGVYQIQCSLSVSEMTLTPPATATVKAKGTTTLMLAKNFIGNYLKFNFVPSQGATGGQTPSGPVDLNGVASLQRVFQAGQYGRPNAPVPLPNGAEVLAFSQLRTNYTDDETNDQLALGETITVSAIVPLLVGDTISVPVYLATEVDSTAQSPSGKQILNDANFQMVKIADSRLAGNFYAESGARVTSLYIDPYPLATATV